MDPIPSRAVEPKAYERHAWIVLLVSGVPMLFGSLAHLLSGMPLAAGLQFAKSNLGATWEQLVAERPEVAASISGFVRMMAVFGLAAFLLFTAMVATSYRRGERWAWFAAWTYPAAILGFVAVATIEDGWAGTEPVQTGSGIAVVMVVILLGLLLPIRMFFPGMDRRPPAS